MRNIFQLSSKIRNLLKVNLFSRTSGIQRDTFRNSASAISATPEPRNSDIIYRSPYPDVEIPRMKWFDFVLSKLPQYGNNPAFIFPAQNVTQKFSDLEWLVKSLASGFLRHGFQPGECLCIVLNNCPEYIITVYAVTTIGGIVTTLNPEFTEEEMAEQMKASETRYVLTSEAHVDKVKQAAAMAGNVQEIILRDEGGVIETGSTSRFSKYQQDDGSYFRDIDVDLDNDIALLPYSSGTTGMPKGVMLTHANLVANACQCHYAFTQKPGSLSLTFLPLFHASGLILTTTMGVLSGMGFVVMDKFDSDKYLQYLQDYKCVTTGIVPIIANFLARSNSVDKYDLSNLNDFICGAAPLSAELQNIVSNRLHVVIRQVYGMTELSPVLSIVERGDNVPGSSGKIVPNTEVKIVDVETGQSLGRHQAGEIVVRGPQVMKGYLSNAEATRKTIIDGWLYTGDIGYMDDDDNLFVSDRVKELIKYSAFQVPPAELEGILMSHDSIADCGVIGIPDNQCDELPRAYVVLKDGHRLKESEIRNFVADRVAPYKRLRGGVKFIETIPRAASGKILRRELRLRGD